MNHVNAVTLVIVLISFLIVTMLGFASGDIAQNCPRNR